MKKVILLFLVIVLTACSPLQSNNAQADMHAAAATNTPVPTPAPIIIPTESAQSRIDRAWMTNPTFESMAEILPTTSFKMKVSAGDGGFIDLNNVSYYMVEIDLNNVSAMFRYIGSCKLPEIRIRNTQKEILEVYQDKTGAKYMTIGSGDFKLNAGLIAACYATWNNVAWQDNHDALAGPEDYGIYIYALLTRMPKEQYVDLVKSSGNGNIAGCSQSGCRLTYTYEEGIISLDDAGLNGLPLRSGSN